MEPEPRTYRPELIPRRGEMIAWASAGLVCLGWLVLLLTGKPVPGSLGFLAVFLILAGASISLGNWMDRQTVLTLDSEGVSFKNGLRNVRLTWEEINRVEIYPSNWGARARVIGKHAHFAFRKLGVVNVGGEEKGRIGFGEGEEIVSRIVRSAGLREVTGSQSGPRGARYYARES